MANKIHIVTVATSDECYFKWLKKSCEKYGTKLQVLGFNKKWEGYTMKYKLLLEYIKNIKQDDIICFIDAYDVLMLKNVEILKQRFLDLKTNKIVCALGNKSDECIINFVEKVYNKIHWSCDNELLNSGTYIGYAENIKDMLLYNLEICNYSSSADDQILLNRYYERYNDKIHVDIEENFFTVKTVFNSGLLDLENYNTNACFIHKPCCLLLNNLIKSEGYDFTLTDEIKTYFSLYNEFTKKLDYHTKNFVN